MINLLAEAKKLIRFNTVTTHSNAECAVYLGRLIQDAGFQVHYQEVREAGQLFMNVIGLRGPGGSAPLLLAAHLDTVDPGDVALWTKTGKDPWKAVVHGDSLYGLGSADDKIDFLAKLAAAASVPSEVLKRPVMLLGTFGEERGLVGASKFCQGPWPRPAMAVVGEPTGLQLVTQHKGLLVGELALMRRGVYHTETAETAYEVEITGAAAHSSAPHLGENAVLRMLDLLRELSQRQNGLKVYSFDGGTAANIVPQRCVALVSAGSKARQALLARRRGVVVHPRRLPAGWHPTIPWAELLTYVQGLNELLASFGKTRDRAYRPPTLTSAVTRVSVIEGALTMLFDVRSLPRQDLNRIASRCEHLAWTLFGPPGDRWQFRRERQNPPLSASASSPVVHLMRRAMRAARIPARVAAKAGCSEAGWYQMVGIPAVVFGPGEAQGNIHQPNERNSLRQIRRAVAVYRAAIELACVKG